MIFKAETAVYIDWSDKGCRFYGEIEIKNIFIVLVLIVGQVEAHQHNLFVQEGSAPIFKLKILENSIRTTKNLCLNKWHAIDLWGLEIITFNHDC